MTLPLVAGAASVRGGRGQVDRPLVGTTDQRHVSASRLSHGCACFALDGDLATAEPKTLRFRVLAAPARYVCTPAGRS
ncbi:hypothetical protein BH24ACT15_BH24ACT15_35370 [soil metagenome]